jgi:hypothetical protein
MSWIKRVLGREKKNPFDDPSLACSFCGKFRHEVMKMIAGPNVYVCDECVGLCNQILDDEHHEQDQRSYFGDALLAQVTHLGRTAAHARARPLLRAVIELERNHPPGLRRVISAAAQIDDLETAVLATRTIPVPDRTTSDVLNLAALLTDQGSHAEALVALATLEPSHLRGVDAILHALHEAFARIERGGLAPRELASRRGKVTELGAACEALPAGPFEDDVRAERLAVMTVAALAAGSIDGAENAARARVVLRPESASAYEYLARVLAARGDEAGARGAREKGLALAHPDGPFAKRLAVAPADGPFR